MIWALWLLSFVSLRRSDNLVSYSSIFIVTVICLRSNLCLRPSGCYPTV
jgi:hypothetical protein